MDPKEEIMDEWEEFFAQVSVDTDLRKIARDIGLKIPEEGLDSLLESVQEKYSVYQFLADRNLIFDYYKEGFRNLKKEESLDS